MHSSGKGSACDVSSVEEKSVVVAEPRARFLDDGVDDDGVDVDDDAVEDE